ncbi:hypothetical protein [Flavobacterium sp.]|uniref:hypothetical protein n=1 Tax=Flavobacterium sp. TaxID=239 RepID=UPI0037533C0A
MDTNDKLFNQIKSAAQNAETKDFSSMDKIWNRVEEKIDKKVLKKETKLWKKIAVAASLLLFVSVAYQYFKSNEEIILPENEIVTSDKLKENTNDSLTIDKELVTTEIQNPLIKKDANIILEKATTSSYQVASNDDLEMNSVPNAVTIDSLSVNGNGNFNTASSNKSGTFMWNRKFDARGVEHKDIVKSESENDFKKAKVAKQSAKKQEPLIVIDGEATDKKLSNLSQEELDSIVVLPEPLYIINGVYYSEQSLFGPNPTSPYSPLIKQEIESTTILNPEKAATIYGEKGKKGVVIIITKDGKPKAIKGN